ncbi:hypothetical protein [Polyangium aurulentum]|uniref:hypothetical protein n=1 Tax=Polyangium aurulentum TaxID=2567896 RepID=UPI0010ADDAC1|nr:hypothetical protein [Polyangium aurulentum]UQA58397.1 hypothetical protein E8A73_045330 [Polyangium aurulentum]
MLAAAWLVAGGVLAACGGRPADQMLTRDEAPAAENMPVLPELNMMADDDVDDAAEETELLGGAVCMSPDGAPYEAESC